MTLTTILVTNFEIYNIQKCTTRVQVHLIHFNENDQSFYKPNTVNDNDDD